MAGRLSVGGLRSEACVLHQVSLGHSGYVRGMLASARNRVSDWTLEASSLTNFQRCGTAARLGSPLDHGGTHKTALNLAADD